MKSLFALALVALLPVAAEALPSHPTTPPHQVHAKAVPHPGATGKGKHCKKNCKNTNQKGLQP